MSSPLPLCRHVFLYLSSLTFFPPFLFPTSSTSLFHLFLASLSFSFTRLLSHYLTINLSLSISWIALSLSLSLHSLLSSSSGSLARQNFSSVVRENSTSLFIASPWPRPLSSLFFCHPSCFFLHISLSTTRAECSSCSYSSRSRDIREGRRERMREIKNFFLFAGLTCTLTITIWPDQFDWNT